MDKDKKLIAVDIDDVLFPFTETFSLYVKKHLPGQELFKIDFQSTVETVGTALNIPSKQAESIITVFLNSDLAKSAVPIAGSTDALNRLARNFRLVIATARTQSMARATKKWVTKNYSNIFENAYFTHQKTELCLRLGAFCLIDDSPDHYTAARQAQLEAILFGNYPWNKGFNGHDWPSIIDQLQPGPTRE